MSSRGHRAAPAAIACLLAAAGLAACGEAKVGSPAANAKTSAGSVVAGAVVGAGDPKPSTTTGTGTIKEVADPQEASSFPAASGSIHNPAAATPAKAGEAIVAAGAPSNAEIKRELQIMHAAESSAKRAQKAQLTPVPGGESIGGSGALPIPTNVPEVVQKVIAGANEIADFPYVFGGGHASFVDNAYDCSGSVSYALAAGGLLSAPEVSGTLESWGVPGPGKYITVYANAGHAYMYVDGVLYDTAGRSGTYASRWQVGSVDNSGFVERHWPGL
jgi:hypothetical protein